MFRRIRSSVPRSAIKRTRLSIAIYNLRPVCGDVPRFQDRVAKTDLLRKCHRLAVFQHQNDGRSRFGNAADQLALATVQRQLAAVHTLAAGDLVVAANDDGNVALTRDGDGLLHAVGAVVHGQRQVVAGTDVRQLDLNVVALALCKVHPGARHRTTALGATVDAQLAVDPDLDVVVARKDQPAVKGVGTAVGADIGTDAGQMRVRILTE